MQLLSNLWWVRLPHLARRGGVTPAAALTDGLYLTAWPPVAAFLPPFVLLLGLFFGWLHPGFTVFSESRMLLLLATLLGVLSGHLGALFLAGFAFGDYFLFYPAWMYTGNVPLNFLYRFALVIEYALLGMLTIQIPLMTKALLAQFYFVAKLGRGFSVLFAFIGHVLLTAVLVYLWGQAVPVLIRPVYTWSGRQPPVSAVVILQNAIWLLLVVAALASIARMALQVFVALSPVHSERLAAFETEIIKDDSKPLTERLPKVLRALLAGAWGALLLSGMYEIWLEGVVVGFVIFCLQAARLGVILVPLGAWARWMAKVPLVIRLGIAAGIVYFLADLILPQMRGGSFRPILILTVIALVLFYFLSPESPAKEVANQEQSA